MAMKPPSIIRDRRPDLVDRARKPAPIDNSGALPSGAWAEILGLAQSDQVVVTGETARGLPALNRARSLVVNGVTSMLCASTISDHGTPATKPLIIGRPHPILTAWTFYEQVVDSLIMHGNYVAIRLDDQMIPVPLGAVSVDGSSGLPVYTIGNRTYSYREVFHIMSNAPIGTWWGMGVVEKHRKSLSEHLYTQNYAEQSFRTGGVPSMLVKLAEKSPGQDRIDEVKSGLMEKVQGKREPLVYPSAVEDVKPVSWSPHDAQFVESRKMSYAEACWLVGLKPEDIGATIAGSGGTISYGNRTDDALQRIVDGYGPWTTMIEQALSDLLPAGVEAHGNPEALLKMSTKERLEVRQLAQAIGVETAEESRAEEGRGPIVTRAEEQSETEEGILS